VATQPSPRDTSANNTALTEQAPPSAPPPIVEASYDAVTKPDSDNESDNTEPGGCDDRTIRVFTVA